MRGPVALALVALVGSPGYADNPVTLGDVGLDAAALDRSVDPCVDFYQFACGGWLAANQIPAEKARWGRGGELDEKNAAAIRTLLDDATKSADPSAKKLGDYYAGCLDELAVERAGLTALRPLLAKTQGVKDAASWLAAVVALHEVRVWVGWSVRTQPDGKDPASYVATLDVPGGDVPDKDRVGRVLALLTPGATPPKNDTRVADVVAIEAELGKLARPAGDRRDSDAKSLAKLVHSVDWKLYWKGLGADPAKLGIAVPRLLGGLDKLRTRFKPAQWASYFTYRLLAQYAFALPKAFDEAAGAPAVDRHRRCTDATRAALGDLIAQQFVAKAFPGNSKQAATQLLDAMVKSLSDGVAGLEWIPAANKAPATARLGQLARLIGYPDKWRTYDFEVKRDDFLGNALRSAAAELHRDLARAGQRVARDDWQVDTSTVNATYLPANNTAVLPAGILQPPFFGQGRGIAVNLGALGMVIGHELTHALDGLEDPVKLAQRRVCIVDEYSAFEAAPKGFVNGKLTAAENIADLGGAVIAFRAYRALRKDAPKLVADGYTEDQQFFIALGQAWCAEDRPAELTRRLAADPHAPPQFRVYGALRNMREFSDAFACPAGTPMHPAKPCSVW